MPSAASDQRKGTPLPFGGSGELKSSLDWLPATGAQGNPCNRLTSSATSHWVAHVMRRDGTRIWSPASLGALTWTTTPWLWTVGGCVAPGFGLDSRRDRAGREKEVRWYRAIRELQTLPVARTKAEMLSCNEIRGERFRLNSPGWRWDRESWDGGPACRGLRKMGRQQGLSGLGRKCRCCFH